MKERQPSDKHFVYENSGLQYEIRSFHPANSKPFNEFKIIDKRQALPILSAIVVDHDADGTLDEVLKGNVMPGNLQPRYTEAIETGLKNKALVKEGGAILLKER